MLDSLSRFWADVAITWPQGHRFLLDAAMMGSMVLAMGVSAVVPMRLAHRGVGRRWIWALLSVTCLYVAGVTSMYVLRGIALYQYVPSSTHRYATNLIQYTLMPLVTVPAMTFLTRMGIAGMKSGAELGALRDEIDAINRDVESLRSRRERR